jgi:Fibronectin type III domain
MQRSVRFVFLGLLLLILAGCGGGEDENLGATATLGWDAVNQSTPVTYTVHYGKQSSGEAGSCHYENTLDVAEPSATITGLEFDTTYYFAVSAFNGLRSYCSNEVSKAIRRPQEDKHPDKEKNQPDNSDK